MVAPTILTLPYEYLPDQESINYIKSIFASLTKKHYEINRAIVESFQLLEEAGCHPVLLKGEGLASLYPNPNLRSCGDIDVYVGEKDFETACHIIDKYCGIPYHQIEKTNHRHYQTRRKGNAIFEVHRIAGDSIFRKYKKSFRRWASNSLQPENCQRVTILGKDILIPNHSFNSLYLLNHYLEHQSEFGIGLRQLVDYALLLHSASISPQIEFGLQRPFLVISGILHQQLGLSQEYLPNYNPQLAQKSQGFALQTILDNGNFGEYNVNYHARYPYGIQRWIQIMKNKYTQLRCLAVFSPQLAINRAILFFPNALYRVVTH